MPLWLLCRLLQWCTSILIPQGSTGSWSREGTGLQCFPCPCSEAGTGNAGGELGDTDIRSGRGDICEISSFRTPGINFSDGLHLPYDCSTSLLTLNCLEIKKGGQKKRAFNFAYWGLSSHRAAKATFVSEKEKHWLAHCSQ